MKILFFTEIILVAMFVASLFACNKSDMPELQEVILTAPAHFPPVSSNQNNPLTKEGVELGRALFYDTRLSGNNKISCATCHHPEKAFSDGVALSAAGVSGTSLHRHAPALINMAWMENGLFWDGGSTNLESQAFAPLTAPDEMNQDLIELVKELNLVPEYVRMFKHVFQDEVKASYIVRALAQFQRTFVSGGSKYDAYIQGIQGISFSGAEKNGLEIVRARCQGCHSGELFTDNGFHNNGLDSDFGNEELEGVFQGRFRITRNDDDLGKFKTPTLRNTMVTAPYMHDGRFQRIEDVLNHYSAHVKLSPSLDEKLRQSSGAPGIPLTVAERENIISFLHTLTDTIFLQNKKLSSPQ